MFDLFAPLFVGLIGSVHCLGMCGPLVMAYSLHLRSADLGSLEMSSSWSHSFAHHIAFHLGRTLTYAALGALTAGLAQLAGLNLFSGLRGTVSLGCGALMVFSGLVLLKAISFRQPSQGLVSFFGRLFPFRSSGLGSKWLLGAAAGFLPCMLSWCMIIKAASTQNPLTGFLSMAFFGLGTMPVLFLAGVSASLLTLRIRILGERVAAISVIAMGIILLYKGARYFA